MPMSLFNEIYGSYFRIAAYALGKETTTDAEVNALIAEHGSDESRVELASMLIPPKNAAVHGGWGLLKRNEDGTLSRVTKYPPPNVLTTLQKRWLKALLSDPRIKLFLTDETYARLSQRLRDTKPLFKAEMFRFFDRFSDGDDHADEGFRRHFAVCLKAVKERCPVYVEYTGGHGRRIRETILPLKMEYSSKNDKFRVYCRRAENKHGAGGAGFQYLTLNIGRIEHISPARNVRIPHSADTLRDMAAARRLSEPVTVRVTEERNSLERFMLEFAHYEKSAERSREGEYTVTLYCRRSEETEVLISLLGFGPTIEILSPPRMREQAAERIKRQYELFFGNTVP